MASRTGLASLGIGWAAGAMASIACYAASVPFPVDVFTIGLVGAGITMFWLNRQENAMPRHFGIPRKPQNEGLGFGPGSTALIAEGVAILIISLGAVVWIAAYATWAQW